MQFWVSSRPRNPKEFKTNTKLSKLLLPIFLLLITISLFQFPRVYGGTPIAFVSDVLQASCGAGGCTVSGLSVQTNDLLMVEPMSTSGCSPAATLASTPSETWTELQSFGGGFEIWDAIAHSTSSYSFTWTCVSAGSGSSSMSASNFRGTFNGFGSVVLDGPLSSSAGAGSDLMNMNVQGGSLVFETLYVPSAGVSLSATSGQTFRYQVPNGNANLQTGVWTSGPTAGSGTISLGVSWSGCTPGPSCGGVFHSGVELTSIPTNPAVGVTTVCYGVCGNPPITLINPNATHTINFNQSSTFLYTVQSQLNGFIGNVTVNVGKSYSNGLVMYLGIYLTQPCSVNQVPFSSNCPGLLQTSRSFTNPSKGQVSMPLQTPIIIGNWIGIAVSSNIGGLDLNETNGSCGITGGVNCAFPPGMVQTSGIMPTSIAQYSVPNVAHLNNTGLWAFVTGSITSVVPPPPLSSTCNITDFSCFEVQSICGLSVSNCLAAGIVYLIIYMAIFILSIFLGVGYLKSKYDIEVHLEHLGSLFIGVFFLLTVLFTTWGIFPVYIPVAEFMILAFTWAIILRSGAESG